MRWRTVPSRCWGFGVFLFVLRHSYKVKEQNYSAAHISSVYTQKSKSNSQVWFHILARSSQLTGIKSGFPAEGDQQEQKGREAQWSSFNSLEIATMACSFLWFFFPSLIIISPPTPHSRHRVLWSMWCLCIPSLAHVSLKRRPVPPRGIPELPTAFFSDWKGSPSCLAFLRVVSSAQNLLISSCWQCHKSSTGRKKSRKPEQRVGWTDEQEESDFYGSTQSKSGICVLFGQSGKVHSSLFNSMVLLLPVEAPPVLPVQMPCGFFSPWIKKYG